MGGHIYVTLKIPYLTVAKRGDDRGDSLELNVGLN